MASARLIATPRARRVWLVAAAALPLLLSTRWIANEQCRRAQAQEGETALEWVRLIAARDQRLVDEAEVLLRLVARMGAVRGGDLEASRELFAELFERHRHYAAVGLGRLDGELLVGLAREDSLGAWIRERLRRGAAGGLVGSPLGTAAGPAFPAFFVTAPTRVRSQDAVAFALVQLAWLEPQPGAPLLPEGASAIMWDASGVVLARFPHAERWRGLVATHTPLFRSAVASKGTRIVEAAGVDGVRRRYAFGSAASPRPGSILAVGFPIEPACAGVRRTAWAGTFGLACMSVIAAALALGRRSGDPRPVSQQP
jgi:hypothetical protein